MLKKSMVLGLLLMAGAVRVYAQNARDMDLLLDTKEVTYAQAARFILPAAGISSEASDTAAFKTALEKKLTPARAEETRAVSTGELSLLLLKAFNIKGGIMYSLFPSPRYAYRELRYLRCVPDDSDPGAKLTGEQFLHILGLVLSYTGDGE